MAYSIADDGFFIESSTGKRERRLTVAGAESHQQWAEKQNASIEQYETDHDSEGMTDDTISNIHSLLKGFISSSIIGRFDKPLKEVRILDVGCGLWKRSPPYIGELAARCTYVGLDPFPGAGEREYPFIQGRVEDVEALLAKEIKFDVFVFSSSLDHFEDVDAVARSVKRLASRESMAIFYLGLHDSSSMTEKFGRDDYKGAVKDLGLPGLLKSWVKLAAFKVPSTLLYLRKREEMLKSGKPMDEKHFNYFTRENVDRYIGKFGKKIDTAYVTGTNAVFISSAISQ